MFQNSQLTLSRNHISHIYFIFFKDHTKLRSILTKDIEYVQGLQLNVINVVLLFSIPAFTESVSRAPLKETQAGTRISVLFGHDGFFPFVFGSE